MSLNNILTNIENRCDINLPCESDFVPLYITACPLNIDIPIFDTRLIYNFVKKEYGIGMRPRKVKGGGCILGKHNYCEFNKFGIYYSKTHVKMYSKEEVANNIRFQEDPNSEVQAQDDKICLKPMQLMNDIRYRLNDLQYFYDSVQLKSNIECIQISFRLKNTFKKMLVRLSGYDMSNHNVNDMCLSQEIFDDFSVKLDDLKTIDGNTGIFRKIFEEIVWCFNADIHRSYIEEYTTLNFENRYANR